MIFFSLLSRVSTELTKPSSAVRYPERENSIHAVPTTDRLITSLAFVAAGRVFVVGQKTLSKRRAKAVGEKTFPSRDFCEAPPRNLEEEKGKLSERKEEKKVGERLSVCQIRQRNFLSLNTAFGGNRR